MINRIKPELRLYVETQVIPRYDKFDKGHQRDHVELVIEQALYLSQFYDVDVNMVYAAAAFHDTGLQKDRETHHLESARIIREDAALRKWFSPAEIEIIAQAAQDHRASSDYEPHTIYGKIVAEADRQIVPQTVIRRTIQYGLSHYPELDKEGHWQRMCHHMKKKYAEGGYLKLWIPESPNAVRLAELRSAIADRVALRSEFERIYSELVKD